MSDNQKEVKTYYMRCNHTFRRLPIDPQEALAVLREERDAGFTFGMLCSKHPKFADESVYADSAENWQGFEERALPWLEKAKALTGVV